MQTQWPACVRRTAHQAVWGAVLAIMSAACAPAHSQVPDSMYAAATPTHPPRTLPALHNHRPQRDRPFAIVDKRGARIAVYRADGTLVGDAPVLLGRDVGDAMVPGVGERTQTGRLRPGDRTTPAGLFDAEPGRNRAGEAIIWVDYAAALAIHRLRPGPQSAQRARRLQADQPGERRVSDGCVVVAAAFFDEVVQPTLGRGPSVVVIRSEYPAE